ncbi:hypothetical protein LSTR_LSTR012012 [Laodelphax striatellus]|uniref:Uncharacterized protein n=1 Tax=Laodelphax striatellus TaxID=195883 RepID=A0A482XN52_LAOST|nr:hypothetical protein LSTR_LSTR012012 [Laodelphax striatellus]
MNLPSHNVKIIIKENKAWKNHSRKMFSIPIGSGVHSFPSQREKILREILTTSTPRVPSIVVQNGPNSFSPAMERPAPHPQRTLSKQAELDEDEEIASVDPAKEKSNEAKPPPPPINNNNSIGLGHRSRWRYRNQ